MKVVFRGELRYSTKSSVAALRGSREDLYEHFMDCLRDSYCLSHSIESLGSAYDTIVSKRCQERTNSPKLETVILFF